MSNAKWWSTGMIVALVFAVLVPMTASAEMRTDYRRSITVSPVELFSGTFNIEYEKATSPAMSWYLGLNYLYFNGLSRTDENRQTVFGPELGLRFYLVGDAPAGVWIGPYLGVAYVHNRSYAEADRMGYGFGGMLGVNLLFGSLNLSLGIGTGWVDYSTPGDGNTERVGLYGFIPRTRLAIGVAF